MSGPSRAEIIARVRKLQDRARRDTGPEARSAASMARGLTRVYGLTREELRPRPSPPTASPAKRVARAAQTAVMVAPAVKVAFRPGDALDLEIGDLRVSWKLGR